MGVNEDTGKGESLCSTERTLNWNIHYGRPYCVPRGTHNGTTLQPEILLTAISSRKLKSVCWKDICILIPVHYRIIHISQDMESIQGSFSRWNGLRKCAIFGWCNVSQLKKIFLTFSTTEMKLENIMLHKIIWSNISWPCFYIDF